MLQHEITSIPLLDVAFFSFLFLVFHTYVGYPLLLTMWSMRRRPLLVRAYSTPRVTIVIAAWNEERNIAARIENCLQQVYPPEMLEIIIVSDGSTDKTSSIVESFVSSGVSLVELETRMGKAVALNVGVAAAHGEIVVFADARQSFSTTAVRELVANFADPSVGAVSGELILESNTAGPAAEGVGLYWTIEKWIRQKEAVIDSIVGATGAIYAIRRDLFEALPPGTILDDLLTPMRIVMRGFRVVFEGRALAFDHVAHDYSNEFKRKVRTLAGNYQVISLCPGLIKPWSNRLCLQFVSHKVCRLVAPVALVGLFITNAAHLGGWYTVFMVIQLMGYTMALAGWWLSKMGVRERLTGAAFTFCLLNYAAVMGAIQFLKAETVQWEKAS
jgi:cellulose synthase/poly-beta-1,6-N-acetylglucosamine synthase-like glycosyltransferase